MNTLINLGAISVGLALLFGTVRFWERDRPIAISLTVTGVLFFTAQLLGPSAT